jgi:putative phosphoesterase
MKLAVIADVHGVLPALETALEEIAGEDVEGIIVAGDMVAGPNSAEVVQRLRERQCWMIQGNNEGYILGYASGRAPDWWFTCRQWAFMRWNFEQLDGETLDFLRSLPEQRRVQLDGTDPIRVVHGSPRGVSEKIEPDADISLLDRVLQEVPEPVLVCGHTHEAWQIQRNGKLALNPGSVSISFKSEHYGSYAILSWKDHHWTAELRGIDYDFELLKDAYVKTGLLDAGNWIARCGLASIRTGIDHMPPMLACAYQKAAEAGYGDSPFVPDPIWDEACREYEETHYQGVL